VGPAVGDGDVGGRGQGEVARGRAALEGGLS